MRRIKIELGAFGSLIFFILSLSLLYFAIGACKYARNWCDEQDKKPNTQCERSEP